MVVKILLDPDAHFHEQANDPVFWAPVALVLLAAVVKVGSYLLVMPNIVTGVGSLSGSLTAVLGVISIVVAVTVALVAWVAYAGIAHVISTKLGGEGSFRKTFLLFGWGMFRPRWADF